MHNDAATMPRTRAAVNTDAPIRGTLNAATEMKPRPQRPPIIWIHGGRVVSGGNSLRKKSMPIAEPTKTTAPFSAIDRDRSQVRATAAFAGPWSAVPTPAMTDNATQNQNIMLAAYPKRCDSDAGIDPALAPRVATPHPRAVPLDARPFLARTEAILQRHALGATGAFARWTLDPARDRGPNAYGVSDAANLLWTLGRFPADARDRAAWVDSLQRFQAPASGLFHEPTHHAIHTTAHCIAALELFDARPAHRLAEVAPLRDAAAMERFLDALDWSGAPWTESHRGAGLYAALHLAGESTPEWEARYFAWLARECDPATGLWRRGAVPAGAAGLGLLFPHLAGTFHYLFNCEHAKQSHPHPGALVDTCLRIRTTRIYPLARFVSFAEMDWVYCLHRAARDCGRLGEARPALRDVAVEYLAYLDGLDPDTDAGLDDLHELFGAVSALAELQSALPGEIASECPLRLVLDRRPFL